MVDVDAGSRLGRVPLMQNDSIAAPLTQGFLWGMSRPVILLPEGFEQLRPESRHAILCHELAHIQGHDFFFRFSPKLRVVRNAERILFGVVLGNCRSYRNFWGMEPGDSATDFCEFWRFRCVHAADRAVFRGCICPRERG